MTGPSPSCVDLFCGLKQVGVLTGSQKFNLNKKASKAVANEILVSMIGVTGDRDGRTNGLARQHDEIGGDKLLRPEVLEPFARTLGPSLNSISVEYASNGLTWHLHHRI